MTKSIELTDAERRLLARLIHIVEASEWQAGDYCLTARQFDVLQRAKEKLQN
jgi:DNA-binding CsgD family transcriptional regulator